MTSTRFDALDSWRGVCALLVATMHLCAQFHYSPMSDVPVTSQFYLLVDFFFVLSGFVIAHAYHDHLANGGSLLRFVIRRVGRLWPLHAAMFLVMVLLEGAKSLAPVDLHSPAFGPGWEPLSVAANFFLLHALGFVPVPNINGPSWTISAELWTNILFAAVVIGVGRRAPAVLAVMAAISVAVLICFTEGRYLDVTTDFGLFRCIYGFTIGFFVYRLWRCRSEAPPVAGLEWLAVILICGFIGLSGWKPLTMTAPLIFGFVVYAFAHQAGILSRLMTGRHMAHIGLWSYSIYLIHWPLFVFLSRFVGLIDAAADTDMKVNHVVDGENMTLVSFGQLPLQMLTTLGVLLLLVLLSSASYRLIESPGRAWFNKLASGDRSIRQLFHLRPHRKPRRLR